MIVKSGHNEQAKYDVGEKTRPSVTEECREELFERRRENKLILC